MACAQEVKLVSMLRISCHTRIKSDRILTRVIDEDYKDYNSVTSFPFSKSVILSIEKPQVQYSTR